ncbi:MAG TPA: efflux RND transporter permease subunit [Vicinamibacterales bacterium]|nr:efflux RND transporter permease subunit [Vicinamibacterales bacterium]
MWIVKLALRRPYTFVVAALLIAILGVLAIARMPTDLLPNIDIPVVSAIWQYKGLSADEMEKRITMPSERSFTTTVNDIEHIESQTVAGIGVIKVFFHPGTAVDAAVAQMTAISQTVTRQMPPGTTPPLIIRFNAASVPILQLGLGGDGLSEQALFDVGSNFLRTGLATVQGASLLQPAGGRARQVMVDLDPKALFALGLSPTDVSAAISAQSPILPAGTAKIGDREYSVRLNNTPGAVALLNDLPVRQQGGATIRLRDVARVRDGGAVQTNIVRQDGRRGALVSVLKTGRASTLEIVDRVKAELPRILSTLPPQLDVRLLLDQSVFVRASIRGVLWEGILAAVLTALMILLFVGSWRSTLIVTTTIPLSILASLVLLYLLGQTINVMTLGGLALAIGILVDEAIVAVENMHRHLAMGKSTIQGVLDGAGEIAVPAFVSFLTISIVFAPVVLLQGTAKYLFQPLAMAVVFAMLASYLLSRTLVPTMARYLLAPEIRANRGGTPGHAPGATGRIWNVHRAFMHRFERFRAAYGRSLSWSLSHPRTVVIVFVGFCAASGLLATQLGQDFFPQVDGGQLRLHVRGPVGSRLETTEQLFARVEDHIRRVIPADRLGTIVDNIGLPVLPINLAYSDSATIGPGDGEILVALSPPRRRGEAWEYARRLREELPNAFPEATFFFRSADMVSQILNFGIPAPIDIQVIGRSPANHGVAKTIEHRLARVPGAVDVRVHQVLDAPELRISVDRTRAAQMGLTQREVAGSVLTSLSSSGQVSPSYWLDPVTGVSYLIAVQTPEHRVTSAEEVGRTPLTSARSGPPQLLTNLATMSHATTPMVASHYNVQPVLDVYGAVQGRDLGSVGREVDRIVADARAQLPRGSAIQVRGQLQTMRTSFMGLAAGLLLAVALVYLVMVINFQSWLDPFIILLALPGAFSGIAWSLYLTQTTVNVPSLMGAIMSVGVATANSILLVTFANQERAGGASAAQAAHAAAITRLRPVLMTAGAMILGMLPMALAIGEGGEQNAPLGTAVIGGLVVATLATLLFVPVAYSLLRSGEGRRPSDADVELLA